MLDVLIFDAKWDKILDYQGYSGICGLQKKSDPEYCGMFSVLLTTPSPHVLGLQKEGLYF